VQSSGGVQAAGEGDADLLADRKTFQDVRHDLRVRRV
jgi:hypothetical protein